jgi:hypothetical protein
MQPYPVVIAFDVTEDFAASLFNTLKNFILD